MNLGPWWSPTHQSWVVWIYVPKTKTWLLDTTPPPR